MTIENEDNWEQTRLAKGKSKKAPSRKNQSNTSDSQPNSNEPGGSIDKSLDDKRRKRE